MGLVLSLAAEEDIVDIAGEGVRLFGAGRAGQYHEDLFTISGLIAANGGAMSLNLSGKS